MDDEALAIHHADQIGAARRDATEAARARREADAARRRTASRVLVGLVVAVPVVAGALLLPHGSPATTIAEVVATVLIGALVLDAVVTLVAYQRTRLRTSSQLRRSRHTVRSVRRARGHYHDPSDQQSGEADPGR